MPFVIVLYSKHLRDMKCIVRNLEVMGSNPGQVEPGMCGTSV